MYHCSWHCSSGVIWQQRLHRGDSSYFTALLVDQAEINDVLKSLVALDDSEIIPAFHLWAGEDGKIDAAELKEAIPLLGEDLTEEEITEMFKLADKDGSGHIDQQEFIQLTNQMQMKGDGTERYKLVGRARAQAYANSRR